VSLKRQLPFETTLKSKQKLTGKNCVPAPPVVKSIYRLAGASSFESAAVRTRCHESSAGCMPVAQYKYMYLYSYLQACVACSMAHVRLSFPANRSYRAFSWKDGRLWIGFDVIHLCKLNSKHACELES